MILIKEKRTKKIDDFDQFFLSVKYQDCCKADPTCKLSLAMPAVYRENLGRKKYGTIIANKIIDHAR
jgi:hypothetical protein